MSFGLTVDVLSEVLPLDTSLSSTSVRRWTHRIGQRLEETRQQPVSNTSVTSPRAYPHIPPRNPVKAIGVDGGYIRRAGVKSRQEGWFEVMVGKSQREDTTGGCFAYVQRLETDPPGRMLQFLDHEGIAADEPVTFLSDGGDTVRQPQFGFFMRGEWVLDWFHVGMRFQQLIQLAKGLGDSEDAHTPDDIVKELHRAKWHLWHGCAYRALQRLEWLTWDVEGFEDTEAKTKLSAKLEEALTYVDRNQGFIVNYGDRYRHGDPISTGFVESAVNQVVSKRFVKKQQMAWSDHNAHRLLQIRTAVLNDELRACYELWYPTMAAANDEPLKAAA